MENDCENANTHTHGGTLGGVGTFTKEKKLELMRINSVKKRVLNFIGGVSDGATGALYRKDRV